MRLSHDADYAAYLYTCNRCRGCMMDKSEDMRPVCPANYFSGFFAYSGGGKAYVCQGILEGMVQPSQETVTVAMNCLLCGACATMCPPGFETQTFIRDLRDYLVQSGQFINDAHKQLLEKARNGEVWENSQMPGDLPVYSGEEEFLVYLGCRERSQMEIIGAVGKILEAAGASWGVLADEGCCGAPLADLGDMTAFEKQAAVNIEMLNGSGAERIVVLCPHGAAAIINDYMMLEELEDILEAEVMSLPQLIAELVEEERIDVSGGDAQTVTFHDPCKIGRFLEDPDSARTILEAMSPVELKEMERTREASWCCGSGAWAELTVPELAEQTVTERLAEAENTGADTLVTACSYCTTFLGKSGGGKMATTHLANLVAENLK
jgi:Fe-S oxidoreductase